MTSFAQYGPGKEELPVNASRGILRRNVANDGWEQKTPETILDDAAGNISVNSHKITDIAPPTPGSSDAATASYADSVGVNSILFGAYRLFSSSLALGTSQPLSLADTLFTGFVPGGSIAARGVIGVVAVSFPSLADETGTGTGQGGFGSAPAADQPYNSTDFPGQHLEVQLVRADGASLIVSDLLTSPPVGQANQAVVAYLSYRSDLGPNLRWRLWFYYQRTSDGYHVSFAPDRALTASAFYVPIVDYLGNLPVGTALGQVSATPGAAGVIPGTLSDVQGVGTANAAGASERFSDAQHVHSHGQQPAGSQGGLAHNLADADHNGFISAAGFSKLAALPSSAVATDTVVGAGSGLTGGGALTGDITLNIGANADGSILVNVDDIQVGVLATDTQHGSRGGGAQHSVATQSVNGFMAATDKVKVDNFAGDTINVTTTTTTETPFDITAYTPTDLHAVTLDVLVTAHRADGAASGSFHLFGGFRRSGSTVTQVGATKVVAFVTDTGFAVDATFTVTGTAINVNVTGVAATTINWRAQGTVVISP